ncbi:MAG: hypothetical protein ACXVCP_12205 [Bdellovibrio sp.]
MEKIAVQMLKCLLIAVSLFTVIHAGAQTLPSWTPTMREVEKIETNFRNELAGEFKKAKVLKKSNSVSVRSFDGDSQPPTAVEQFLELTRINVLIGAFAKVDLKVVEFTIQPYVELRFDK